MKSVRIYHNPNCSTSRFAVEQAAERGVEAEIVLYLKTKPGRDELADLIAKLEDPAADLVRKDAFFATLDIDGDQVTEVSDVLDLLVAHPRLLQRPVLVGDNRAIIGRPKSRVGEFLES